MNKRIEAVVTVAFIVLLGFNVGYFGPRLLPPSAPKFVLLPQAYALSTPSSYLSFEGQLTDQNGNPVSAQETFNFSLWSSSSATTAAFHVYCETQTITPDFRGIFNAQIGSGTGCTGTSWTGDTTWPPSFNGPYWINVVVSGTTLSPRVALTAAPYLNGQVPWGNLISFPSACGAGSAVTGVTSTLQCQQFMTAISSTSCGVGSALNTASGTTFGCTLLPTPTTSCAAGAALTSISGTAVTCAALSQHISTAATVSCASNSYITSLGTTSAVCAQPVIFVFDTSTLSRSATALTTVSGLSASVAASTTYLVQAFIPYTTTAAVANNLKLGVSAPTGTTIQLNFYEPLSSTVHVNYVETATSTSFSTTGGPEGTLEGVWVSGYITTGTTAGTFQFLYGVNRVASGTTSTVTIFGGSWMRLEATSA